MYTIRKLSDLFSEDVGALAPTGRLGRERVESYGYFFIIPFFASIVLAKLVSALQIYCTKLL
jgi:hypothetical protein